MATVEHGKFTLVACHFDAEIIHTDDFAGWDPVGGQTVIDVVILDGVGALRQECRPYLSSSIFVAAPPETCPGRGIARDASMGPSELIRRRGRRGADTRMNISNATIGEAR